jgi:hypothetical protein
LDMDYPALGGRFKDRVLTYPTPDLRDLIFFEEKDQRLSLNDPDGAALEYGSPHPDTLTYPNHVLALISPADERGKARWWWVRDRQDQDAYNLENQYPYNGDKDYPRYIRTYITRRTEYAPFAKTVKEPTDDATYLVDQRRTRIGDQQLDSLYVAHQVVWDRLPGPILVQEDDDEEFCTVTTYTQRDELSNLTRPDEGDAYDGKFVLSARLEDLGGGVGQLTIRAVALPTPLKERERTDPVFCLVTEFWQYGVAGSMTPPSQGDSFEGLTVIEGRLSPVGCGLERLDVSAATVPSAIRTSTTTDSETNELVTTTSQVVFTDNPTNASPADPTIPAPAPGEEIELKPLGCALSLYIKGDIDTPQDREEVRMVDMTFPALLRSLTLNAGSTLSGEEFFKIHPDIRSAFKQKVPARLEISYHETEPTPDPTLYQWLPDDVFYDGIHFNLRISNVLHNAISITATTSSSNPTWGATGETFTLAASAPTYSQYVSDIGDEKLVDEDITRWRNNLWRRVKTYVELR